jgi:hypothetical protein
MSIQDTNARPRAQDAAASLSEIKNPQSAAQLQKFRAGGIWRGGVDALQKISRGGKSHLQLNILISDSEPATWVNALVFDMEAIDAASTGKIIKSAKVYVEGRLTLDQGMAGDGNRRRRLSAMVRCCRNPKIGRDRPKKPQGRGADHQQLPEHHFRR